VKLSETNCATIATATSSRVLYGIGHAHGMLRRVGEHTRVSTDPCLERLLDWKDTRNNTFETTTPKQSEAIRMDRSKTCSGSCGIF